jgi:hypothetical protein
MTNEPAERLRAFVIANDIYLQGMPDMLDKALAAERRATVERIAARFNDELGVSVLVVKAMRMIMEDLDTEGTS